MQKQHGRNEHGNGERQITAATLGIEITAPPWPGAFPTFWQRAHTAETGEYHPEPRTVPYATRGRDHETGHITGKLQSMPTSIQLITGAGGTNGQQW